MTLDLPSEALIGDTITFTVNVDPATTTGFGPYLDLLFDSTGIDGVSTANNDGISFVSATAFGISLNTFTTTQTLTGGSVTDANGVLIAPTIISSNGYAAGDQLVTIDLPFGSFVPGQPSIP